MKRKPFFIIKLESPRSLNSLAGADYTKLASFLEIADNDRDIYFTILTSTGSYFSSGADWTSIRDAQSIEQDETEKWLQNFAARNLYVTDTFARHSKILICCLNGPAIGLSAAIVLLCDIVYSMNDKVYILFPFSRLGLVTEGGVGVTLPMKLGYNQAMEHLAFSKMIKFDELTKSGIIVENFNMNDTDSFNDAVINHITTKIQEIHLPSILGIKKVLRQNLERDLSMINTMEVNDSMKFWLKGEPQRRFAKLSQRQRRSKL